MKDKTKTYSYATTDDFLEDLKEIFEKEVSPDVRPNFLSSTIDTAEITHELKTGQDRSTISPLEQNLAIPHRFSFKLIKESTELYISAEENSEAFYRWTDRLIKGTEDRKSRNASQIKHKALRHEYIKKVDAQIEMMEKARKELKDDVDAKKTLNIYSGTALNFLKIANSLHGNVPDYGPHVGINIQVGPRRHLNFERSGTDVTATPGSYQSLLMSPHRGQIAGTKCKKFIVTTSGHKVPIAALNSEYRKLIDERGIDPTSIDQASLPELPQKT